MPESEPKPAATPPDYKLVREISLIFRAMGAHWHDNEEPTLAKEILELGRVSRELAKKMRKRRPKL